MKISMNMKKKNGVFSMLMLVTALFFAACSDENFDEKGGDNGELPEVYTIFTNKPTTRTSMDATGTHHWMSGDKVWLRVNDKLVAASSMEISDNTNWADFYFAGKYEDDEYKIIYPGSNATMVDGTSGKKEFKVTIPSQQVQKTADNSEHYAVSGDCAIAEAKKQEDGTYKFNLRHQMSYIMFEPRITTTSEKPAKIRKITITELDGKNICGTFNLNEDTCDIDNVENGSSIIEVICGEDVLKGEDFAGSPNYGFPVKNERDPENNRIFVVIRPNKPGETYRLKVDFEMISYMTQRTEHDDEDENWSYKYELHTKSENREITAYCGVNQYLIGKQALTPDAPPTPDYIYNFEEYYMWGADDWFWKQAVKDGYGYPFYNDEHQSEGQPSVGSSSWFDDYYQAGDVWMYPYGQTYNGKFSSDLKVLMEGGTPGVSADSVPASDYTLRHRQAQWNGVLTANQMTYYVKYGDPHYDNTTSWALKTYNGVYTICYGGVWLKKKAAIIRDNPSISWPGDNDAPRNQKTAYSVDGVQNGNLRYCAPINNYRTNYKNQGQFDKKPWELDPSKKEGDYFFLPCLGRIEYTGKTAKTYNGERVPGTSDPTMTLVGSQGFYWTKTPVQNNFGSTRWAKYTYPFAKVGNWNEVITSEYSGLDEYAEGMELERYTNYKELSGYNDNAFYFNIHYKYIALSWQQPGIYVKTGMRKASTSMFK